LDINSLTSYLRNSRERERWLTDAVTQLSDQQAYEHVGAVDPFNIESRGFESENPEDDDSE